MNPAVTRKPSHQTCLHDIVKKENWESLLNTLSVAQGTHDVNTKDSDGNTALHIAVTEVSSICELYIYSIPNEHK